MSELARARAVKCKYISLKDLYYIYARVKCTLRVALASVDKNYWKIPIATLAYPQCTVFKILLLLLFNAIFECQEKSRILFEPFVNRRCTQKL